MERIPKTWMFTLGLSVLAIVAAGLVHFADRTPEPSDSLSIEAESCVRYGRFECCVRED